MEVDAPSQRPPSSNALEAWASLASVISGDVIAKNTKPDPVEVSKAVSVLRADGLSKFFVAHFSDMVQSYCLETVYPKLWSRFDQVPLDEIQQAITPEHDEKDSLPQEILSQLQVLEQHLLDGLEEINTLLSRVDSLDHLLTRTAGLSAGASASAALRPLVAAMHSKPPATFISVLTLYLRLSLRAPEQLRLSAVSHQLRHLYFAPVLERISAELLLVRIRLKVTSTAGDRFEAELLPEIFQWFGFLLQWLKVVLADDPAAARLRDRLKFAVYEAFATLRISELFDILKLYPDSTPALMDLKECLSYTHQHAQLEASLRQSLKQRLLQPGASTDAIIEQYISTIKALLLVDPSGQTLDRVAQPIRHYLSARADAIRCIVSKLTNEKNLEDEHNELYEELRSAGDDPADDGDDDAADASWQPAVFDPENVTASADHEAHRKKDVISMIVSIYGSNELFVNEYRTMLAESLLAKLDFNTDRELHIVELLKLRFGESSLDQCSIMLSDMAASKRTDTHIHTKIDSQPDMPLAPVFHSSILSHLFWPTHKLEPMELHPNIARVAEAYKREFEEFKGSRKLAFRPQMGVVQLELEVGGAITSFTVSPVLATIVQHFADQPQWTLQALSERTKLTPDVLRKRLAYWTTAGVLHESAKDLFSVCSTSSAPTATAGAGAPDEEDASATSAATAVEDESLEMLRAFIFGMLTNSDGGSMTVSQIHTTLSMLGLPINKTLPQLMQFLSNDVKRADSKFEKGSGTGPDTVYSIKQGAPM